MVFVRRLCAKYDLTIVRQFLLEYLFAIFVDNTKIRIALECRSKPAYNMIWYLQG